MKDIVTSNVLVIGVGLGERASFLHVPSFSLAVVHMHALKLGARRVRVDASRVQRVVDPNHWVVRCGFFLNNVLYPSTML